MRVYRTLSFPGVPASFTDDFGSLTGLQTFKVVGDTNVPGMFPLNQSLLFSVSDLLKFGSF